MSHLAPREWQQGQLGAAGRTVGVPTDSLKIPLLWYVSQHSQLHMDMLWPLMSMMEPMRAGTDGAMLC